MKISNFDNPLFIFLIFISTLLINTLSSIYFAPVLLVGVLFLAFQTCLKRSYYYSLLFICASFLFIELNNGFKPVSLILLAFFMYVFIVPYMKRVLSFNKLNDYIFIALFYVGVIILWSINNDVSIELIFTVLINIFIDFIIFWIII